MTMMTSARAISAFAAPAPAPNPQTPQEIADSLMAAWTAFQAKNDQRIGQIEARGEDAVTRDEVEKVNAAITELKASLDQQARNIGRVTAGGVANDNAGDVQRHARSFFAAAGRPVQRGATADVQVYAQYRAAFDHLIRSGLNVDMVDNDYRAALSIGSDRDGGYLVPTEMSSEIERRIFDTSPMRQVARIITIGVSAWEAPYKASKGVSGGWVGERQPRPATDTGPVGMQRIETHEQYAYPEVTQAMLDDGALDVEAFLVDDTEDEMSRTENLGFVSGDGNMKPKGFLHYSGASVTTRDADRSWGALQYIPSGAAGSFPTLTGGAHNPNALIDTITSLNPSYRAGAAWAMNRTTEAEIRKLKDGEGRYFVGLGSVEGGLRFNIFGFPIVNMEDMPDVASNTYSAAFGNWRRGYFILDRRGFRVLRDPYTNKPMVGFYITKRTGGDVRNFDALKLLKFSQT